MVVESIAADEIEFKPATAGEWKDLETLFNQFGRFKGCWCMYWRLKRSEFNKQFGEGNKKALNALVESGEVPGILAYYEKQPIGWCSVAPREAFPVLDRSPVLKRVDEKPVWSIVCFFVAKPFRGQGLMELLTRAAVDYAKSNGAEIIEAYPVIPEQSKNPSLEAYTGIRTTFERLGFKEVVRRSRIRPIMRYYVPD